MSEALQHTTPDPVVLHQHLRNLYAEGVTHCILEASSHGLDQRRLDGLRVRLAGFTNLTHDHLDYHATEEIYFAAKARLFTELLDAEGGAVIFTDHAAGQKMADAVRAAGRAVLTVGTSEADLTVTQISRHMSGQKLSFTYEGQSCEANLAVIGDFQLENLGVAVGMAMASGIHLSDIDLSALTAPPGRMQWAGESAHAAHVYVDYAHTPDALLRVLQTVRKHAEGRVMVVFGCGGDRDQDKRGAMGAIADREADIVFVTDDNPRGEDGAKIRAMILAQCPRAIEVPDRRAAIQQAVAAGQAGDIIVVAGKGHETGQIIGQQVLPFDDLKEVRRALGGDGGAGDIVQGGVDG